VDRREVNSPVRGSVELVPHEERGKSGPREIHVLIVEDERTAGQYQELKCILAELGLTK
jgi:hypothetical protein